MNKKPNHELSEMACPHQLADVDLFAQGAQEHWYEAYDILHNEAPVHRIPGEGFMPGTDAFILTRYEDISRVVKDEQRYPPALSLMIRQLSESPQAAVNMNTMIQSMVSLRPNPELWRTHRQELTDPWVGPGASRHKSMIVDVAHSLIDQWVDEEKVDFVSQFAQPLPQMVMAKVLGWPIEDLKLLKHFGDGTVKAFVYGSGHRCILPTEEVRSQLEVLQEFQAYTNALIAARRSAPEEDMITFLTTVEYSPLNRKLTDAEINGIVYAMVIGGLETTQYALAEQVQLVIENHAVWQALKADKRKVRAFTEEGMRLRAPTQGLSTRTTSQEEVFQGVAVPKGSFLHMRWAAANIDPLEWDDPTELKLDRKAGTRHLTFSQGARVCPGASLSRLEQVEAWNALIDRIDHFEYAQDNTFTHQPGIMLGITKLNLAFKKQ
ncbi:cytochrome P450 [Pseudomonadales bacterium]|jgi:cytochrome P450|nr:cytochrome P450 [Pseudomonadales bacterium]MDA8880430.1 cytochrome P450 [Pseudomonadales bacterium]MDC1017308.1 cytochrome P450 [Pseudomonadales bacterium]